MLLAGSFWSLDSYFCSTLTSLRRQVALSGRNNPSNLSRNLTALLLPLSQLHGWWHLLAGYSVYMQNIYLTFQRQKVLNNGRNYELGYFGLSVKEKRP